jgi:hypothetical protein
LGSVCVCVCLFWHYIDPLSSSSSSLSLHACLSVLDWMYCGVHLVSIFSGRALHVSWEQGGSYLQRSLTVAGIGGCFL